MATLCATMARLRAPGGCAWDREQTLKSLKPYLLEEAYEVLDSIDKGSTAEHCEELGDLLLQVVFQAEVSRESKGFDLQAVAAGINAKLIRRHPHIFAEAVAHTADEALSQWESVKAQERGAGKSRLSGVPRAMPGLLRAYRVSEKAAAAGFDWPHAQACEGKFHEEWGEFKEAWQQGSHAAMVDEMGDVFMSLVSLCRHLKIDPEAALSQTIDKFTGRFEHIERSLGADEGPMEKVGLKRLEALWDDAKAAEA